MSRFTECQSLTAALATTATTAAVQTSLLKSFSLPATASPANSPSLNPPGTCSRVASAATQENRAKPSAALARAPLPESADEESDGAAPAGTTCAAAASSPASSHPCAHRTSSGAAHTPARNPARPINDLLVHSTPLCAECHTLQPTPLRKAGKESPIHFL